MAGAKMHQGQNGRVPMLQIERSGLKVAVVTEPLRQNFARSHAIF
jgi:hypothetical protein